MKSVGVIVFLSLFMAISNLNAQDVPVVRLLEEVHDFGEINEIDGPVAHTFKFLNVGSGALAILDVKATCGCTLPDWSKKVILPGDTGFVVVSFNPYNRPGTFRKSLTVTTNAEATTFLYVKGTVKPKPETIIENLPNQMGALRTRYRSFNLGRMTNEKVFSKSFDIYNQGAEDLSFLDKFEAPSNISISWSPKTLKPGELGSLTLSYDPGDLELLGFNSHELVLFTDERDNSRKAFNVLATVEEFFPLLSDEEAAKVPVLAIDEQQVDFGKVDQGEIITGVFTLTNAGIDPLQIRSLKSNCDCTKGVLYNRTIQEGESEKLQVIFDTSGRKGNQLKMLTIFSNDPNNPTQTVRLTGYVNFEDID